MPKKTTESKPTPQSPEEKSTPESEIKPENSNQFPMNIFKNKWAIVGLCFIVLIGAGFIAYNKFWSDDNQQIEEELTYAEQLETFTIAEGADQDTFNNVMLTRATAHVAEKNYQAALDRLNSISNPNSSTKVGADELYALIYRELGQTEKALEYGRFALAEQEKQLLENIKDAPDLHFSLAKLYENAGEINKAKTHYQLFIDEFDAPAEDLSEDHIIRALEVSKQKVSSL